MNTLLETAKQQRKFVHANLIVDSWESVKPYFEQLHAFEFLSVDDVILWLQKRSELESVLEEEMAWRYILMNCDTQHKEYAQSFQRYVSEIEPHVQLFANLLDKKLLSSAFLSQLGSEYAIALRNIANRIELFCEKNIPIIAELQQQEQEYGVINSKMTIHFDGSEKTLQQAAVYLKDTNRDVRHDVYSLIAQRRLQDEKALHDLLSSLIEKRHQIAVNAGYENYRDYKFKELARFDYSIQDCFDFHNSIQKTVPSILTKIYSERKQALGLGELKPWDLDVDIYGRLPLRPFVQAQDLLEKSIACFEKIKPEYADVLRRMKEVGYLDLESRIGKAPGGFNYPLYESNLPFIFMNAAGTLRDVETLMHEGGHALHSWYSSHLSIVEFKSLPSEVAELASMSMELISMEHWHHFFDSEEDLSRAKRSQLEGIISVLSWVAIVDKFQHALYEKPNHTTQEREAMWLSIITDFDAQVVDWNGLEHVRANMWQKQLHIFEVPFYYIEYGIAQLGAIAIWKNYKQNPDATLHAYETFLQKGYTVPIPELYKLAGIEFSFSYTYVHELLDFVQQELQVLA